MKKYSWLLAPFVGNIFEWYEFAIFSSLSGIIGRLFFDSTDYISATMLGFVIYGIAFIGRPFGTYIFGYIGDKYGRKKALFSSLLLMCIATFAIPLIPIYSQLGIWSSILIIIARIIQGVSLGGEYSSIVTYTMEKAPLGKKGLFSAIQTSSGFIAILLGLFSVLLLHNFYTESEILSFAWKIPFFLSIFIGFFGIYIRLQATESEEFLKIKQQNKTVKNPFLHFFKNYYKEFFICGSLVLVTSVSAHVFVISIKTVFEIILKFNSQTSSKYAILICLIIMPFIVISGMLADKIELQKFRKNYTFVTPFVSIFGAYLSMSNNNLTIFCGIALIAIIFSIGLGFYPYYLYINIPTEVRETGVGFSISIPAMISAGFGMLILLKLFELYQLYSIFVMVVIINIMAFIGLFIDFKLFRK